MFFLVLRVNLFEASQRCNFLSSEFTHAGDFVRRFWPRKRAKKIWAAILATQSELERLEISFLKAPQALGVMFWHLASNFLASSSLDLSFDTKFAVV